MTLKEQIAARLTEVRDIAAKAEGEERDFSEDENQQLGAKLAEIEDLKAKDKKADESADLKARIEAVSGDEAGQLNEKSLNGSTVGVQGTRKTAGELFVEGEAYQGLLKAYPNGVSDSARGIHLQPTPMKGGMKALLGTDDSSALVRPDYVGPQPMVFAPLVLRQVITVGTTGSDTVEYAQVASRTNAAAPVATATSTSDGQKPESSLSFEKVTAPVRTLAHWLPVTKRALSDAAQVRTYIDQFLRDGLEQVTEDQMMNGDGTGENFTGILATTGTQAQDFSVNAIETIRKAITKVQTYGTNTTGVVVSPADNEALDLAKDTQDRYYGNGPFGQGPNTIWGVPRIVSTKLGEGQAIVGDMRTCVLWDREQASVTVSDSHSDFFTRNLVAILSEMRAAFGILDPKRLVVAELTSAT